MSTILTTASVMKTSTEVLLRDVHRLFKCHFCHGAPLLPPVYACRLGHAVCADCHGLTQKQPSECLECQEPLVVRNLPIENTLLPVLLNVPQDLAALWENGKDEGDREWSQKPNVEVGTLTSLRTAETMADVIIQDSYAQMLTSGRTVQCPFPCGLMVTAPGLYRHFSFQHPEVFLAMLCKNHHFSINIPYQILACLNENSTSCCVYIVVVDISDQPKEDNMNAAELLSIMNNMNTMLLRQKYLALLSISRHSTPEAYAVWVTALYDFSPVKYTLRYNNGVGCVSYQGRPRSLFMPVDTTSGLLLPSALLKRNLPSEALELTLVFHLDLPFPQGLPFENEPERNPPPNLSEL